MAPTQATLRTLFALAWPMVLARSTQAVITLADTLQVKHLGPKAVAAAATGGLNVFLVVIGFMGTAFIVQSFVAQLQGQGRLTETPRYAWYGLAIAAIAGVLSVLLIPLVRPLLGMTAFAPDVAGPMADYMDIRLLSVVTVVGTEALANFYGGMGNTQYGMRAAIVTMVANIFLNWVFIDGHFGAPAMGVRGAALASALASGLGLAVLLVLFALGKGGVARPRGPSGLRARELWRVLRFGVPNGLNWLAEFAAFQLFVNIVFAKLGSVASASMNVVLAINMVGFMPAFGLASAGSILVAGAIGAGKPDDVGRIVRLTLWCNIAWMSAMSLAYLIVPETLAGFFAGGDEGAALVGVAVGMLRISALWQFADAIGLTLGEALRGAGDTKWPAWARLLLAWGLFFPGAWLLVRYAGAGPMLATFALAVYLGLLSVALWWRFRSGAWRSIKMVEPQLIETSHAS